MKGRAKLFPMMLALVLVTGCKASSEDSAQTANMTEQPLGAAPLDNPPPTLPETPPSKPAPIVTVHAQPAPKFPLDLPPSDDAAQPEPFPAEVTAFMVDRDSCDHFRGEEPYDAERRAYIEESIAELCTGTDVKLATLRHRYDKVPEVIAALHGYDDRIEGEQP
ncbi:hypothetical protein PMI04_015910 [Sphingobium sp. AP49]|uniref:hypothetical protein n=1 Tax=Sphingobium sp. AP49 TaxID=1144307 RepID=UPI00026EE745|nr:hypothetical protein [Sphingobium sp. AP49]WHO38033.1 hypothetical protein PMI04_015910 [Sphingobium sp. AP49]